MGRGLDVLDQLTNQMATLGTGVIGDTTRAIVYDALGQVTRITDDDSIVERVYDSLGRLSSETQGSNPLGTSGKTFQFGYDAAGRPTNITYPDGTVEQRNRDAVGRLSSVAIQGGATVATYKYAGARIPQVTLANNVIRTQSFDALQRVTHVEYTKSTTSLRKFEYVFDLADHRLLEKRHHANGTGDNYTLDSLYRTVLVKAGVADPVLENQTPGSQTVTSTSTPTYDAAGNRSQVAVTSGGTTTTTNYSSDTLNFYSSVGGITQVRDANGNLKDDGTNTYEWDYRNQLVRIKKKSDSSVVGTYEYDGIGRRRAKTAGGTTISFYWIDRRMAVEEDAQGLVSRRHYGATIGTVVSSSQRDVADLDQDGNTTEYLSLTPVYDGAFDTVAVLDHAGVIAESYVHSYDGSVTILNAGGATIPASGILWRQGYGGMYRDAESGMLYSVHRYYSSTVGRFVSEDPMGRWHDAVNRGGGFTRIGNSYRNGIDPWGLETKPSPNRILGHLSVASLANFGNGIEGQDP